MSWFGRVRNEFAAVTAPFVGRPICYVEVGVFTGDSAVWTLENVLTHPDAHGIGVDHYPADRKRTPEVIEGIRQEAIKRLEPYTAAGKWRWIFQPSRLALRYNVPTPIDLLYLDGAHEAPDVLCDFCYAWPSLAPGSVVVFDDLGIGERHEAKGVAHVPTACRAVAEVFRDRIEVVNPGPRQFAIRVK